MDSTSFVTIARSVSASAEHPYQESLPNLSGFKWLANLMPVSARPSGKSRQFNHGSTWREPSLSPIKGRNSTEKI